MLQQEGVPNSAPDPLEASYLHCPFDATTPMERPGMYAFVALGAGVFPLYTSTTGQPRFVFGQ